MKKFLTKFTQAMFFLFFLLIGAGCGLMIVDFIDAVYTRTGENDLIYFFLLLLAMYIVIFLQIIIHEAGHLVFGLLSGYSFSSFRIGSFIWSKKDNKIQFGRLSLAGTGGQCLMCPPEMKDGKLPCVLYNLGGSIMNLVSAVIFFLLSVILRDFLMLAVILRMGALIGVAFALMNGIPMRLGTVDNDGYNALALRNDPLAALSIWLQLKVCHEQTKGLRLKDMPEEWFFVPDDEAMKNSLNSAVGIFTCNRLMDQHRFEEADALMERLLALDSGIVGIHRCIAQSDRIFCELIGKNRAEVIDSLLTKEQKKMMKSMKNNLSIIRTEYALAVLHEKDEKKAAKLLQFFDKMCSSYPYEGERESEQELIAMIQNR